MGVIPRRRGPIPGMIAACLVGCFMQVHSVDAEAQEATRVYTVDERFASVLRPDGIAVGALRLYPQVGVGVLTSDNVFATGNMEQSDWAITTFIDAILRSNTSRYSFELGAHADLARFSDFEVNDYDDGELWIAGGVHVTGSSHLELDMNVATLAEPRTSVNSPADSVELTEYQRSTLVGIYRYRPSRWRLRLDGRYRDLDFDDVATPGGFENNDDRDRREYEFGTRIGYDFAESYGLFVEARSSSVDYQQRIDDEGFARSFDGYEARLGTELRLTGVVTGELFLGYLSRDFSDARFPRAEGVSFGAEIDWVITNLTTVSIAGSRVTEPTTVLGASTITDTRYALSVDHELRRNLVLSVDVEFGDEDFEGIGREDKIVRGGFSVRYRMNRKLWLEAGYFHRDRDGAPSGRGGRDYAINEVSVDVMYQL